LNCRGQQVQRAAENLLGVGYLFRHRHTTLSRSEPRCQPSAPRFSQVNLGLRTLQRTFYEELAITDALSVKSLTAAIQGDHYQSALEQPKGKPLTIPRPTDASSVNAP